MSDREKREKREEFEEERDAFAKMIAASGISNEDFHAALAEFDREHENKEGGGENN